MKYYKVKKEYDNHPKDKTAGGHYICNGNFYIGGELYTEKEVKRQKLELKFMEEVQAPKNKSYWLFGARFNSTLKKGAEWYGNSKKRGIASTFW